MNIATATRALLDELVRMRTEGTERIYIDEKTIRDLELLLNSNAASTDSGNESSDVSRERTAKDSLGSEIKQKKDITITDHPSTIVKPSKEVESKLPSPPILDIPKGDKSEQWKWLEDKVLNCETCNSELNPNGKIVVGQGNLNADLFLCGEAPGADEEIEGMPFIGPAGELLIKILNAMGLEREKVYLGNILNWRPRHNQSYGNRPPTKEEINFCLPYLKAQLKIVQPKIIVALGKTATDGLLGHDPKRRLSHVRGKWYEFSGAPMMITYHPSYLLHNPSKTSKRRVWEDFLLVMEKLEMEISEKQRGFFL